jgi:hypothetical protein
MEGKYLGGAKRGSSDCSSLRCERPYLLPSPMEARHNCSRSGFSVHNYTSIGEVWFWVQKKELTGLRFELKTFSAVTSCSIVELVLVEGELPL